MPNAEKVSYSSCARAAALYLQNSLPVVNAAWNQPGSGQGPGCASAAARAHARAGGPLHSARARHAAQERLPLDEHRARVRALSARPRRRPGERGLRPRAFSSTSESRLPINRLAPVSCCFLSWLALFTRMGLPYTLIMFRILIACAPARTASRAGRQPVSPRGGRRAHGPRAAAGRAGGNGFAHSPRRPHCETPQSRSPGACWSRGPWAGTR